MDSNLNLIEPDVLMRAVDNNTSVFVHLLGVFLRICPEMLDRLEQSVTSGNQASICQQAHSLKGCLLLIGAERTSEKLNLMERAARNNEANCDPAYFASLRIEFDQVIAEVQACLAEKNASDENA